MQLNKTDILAQLQKEILPLQGLKLPASTCNEQIELGLMNYAFPNARFPFGAVHEFFSTGTENSSATKGFITCLISFIMRSGGVVVWVGPSSAVFPPGLKTLGVEPDRIIFIDLKKEKDILWAIEECLKCEGLAAVIGEISEISFTASRKFQLAVEQSRVTGFILRNNPRNLNPNACVSRWKITALPSELPDDMPGVGFPRWNIEILKIRNGKPGTWQMEWCAGEFRHVSPSIASIPQKLKRKTG